MTTTAYALNPSAWTLIASGVSYVDVQGPTGKFMVAVGTAAPTSLTTGIIPNQVDGRYLLTGVASGDNVYAMPTGTGPVNVDVIAENYSSGGAVTIADGADVALGAKADAAWSSGSGSAIALLKATVNALNAALPAGTNSIGSVQLAISAATVLTSGTAYDYTKFGSIQVQVDTLSSGESVAVTGSSTSGGTYYPLGQLLNQNTGTTTGTAAVAGTYSALFAGSKWLKFTTSGGTGTAVITVSASQ
jgi:hypothetical protein